MNSDIPSGFNIHDSEEEHCFLQMPSLQNTPLSAMCVRGMLSQRMPYTKYSTTAKRTKAMGIHGGILIDGGRGMAASFLVLAELP